MWKYNILKRFCSEPRLESQFDKRTNKTYSSYMIYSSANSKSNPLFKLKRKLERQEKLKLEGIDEDKTPQLYTNENFNASDIYLVKNTKN